MNHNLELSNIQNTEFSIKIIGINDPRLIAEVSAIISCYCDDFKPSLDLKISYSNKQNYISITARIIAQSKSHLDTIYTELNKHQLVRITL